MKAQTQFITPINQRDIKNSTSYFNARDIKRIGLSPFQTLGSLGGVMRRPEHTPSKITKRVYANTVTPLTVPKVQTGLSIEKPSPFKDSITKITAATGALVALAGTKLHSGVSAITTTIGNAVSGVKHRPGLALYVLPLVVGGLVSYTFFSMMASGNSGSAGNAASGTWSTTDKAAGDTFTVNSGDKTRDSSAWSGKKESVSNGNTQSTSATGAPTTQNSGTMTTNIPAGGATNVLPSGIPGVTEPVTTTIPGTTTTVDDKPAVITDPTAITLN
jgi:hypothetical protein